GERYLHLHCLRERINDDSCLSGSERTGRRNFARPEQDGGVSNDTSICRLPKKESGNHRHVQDFHRLLLFPVPGTKCHVSGRGRWHRLNYKCWEHTMSNRSLSTSTNTYTRCYKRAGCRPTYSREACAAHRGRHRGQFRGRGTRGIGDIVLAGRYATKNHLKRFRSAAVDGTDGDLQQRPEYSTRHAAAASRAIIRAEAGAGERRSVCSVAHPARRRGG